MICSAVHQCLLGCIGSGSCSHSQSASSTSTSTTSTAPKNAGGKCPLCDMSFLLVDAINVDSRRGPSAAFQCRDEAPAPPLVDSAQRGKQLTASTSCDDVDANSLPTWRPSSKLIWLVKQLSLLRQQEPDTKVTFRHQKKATHSTI